MSDVSVPAQGRAVLRISRRKFVAFTFVAAALSLGFTLGVLLALDTYVHHRVEKLAGVNIWGYRGPVVGKKKPGEKRIVVLGGSTVLGYGVPWHEAFPAILERKVNERRRLAGLPPSSVVNLGYNNEGAYSFKYTMEDYAYLDFDVACLYEGYNDHGDRPNYQVYRRESPVFRLTGYLPVLPVVLREKSMVLRYGRDFAAGYRRDKTVFRPDLADRATAAALDTAAAISESLEHQLGRLSSPQPIQAVSPETCGEPYRHYCGAIYDAVAYGLSQQKKVVFISQPYISDTHALQQRAVAAMLAERFRGNPNVRYVDGGPAVDLRDRRLSADGMHLTAAGNDRIAETLVEPVLELLTKS